MKRVVIYVRPEQDGDEHIQKAEAVLYALRQHREVMAIATEAPGETAAWESAVRTVREGRADAVLIPAGVQTPPIVPIEVVGQDYRDDGAAARRTHRL